MTDNSIARVNYFARQFLGTQDFEDEQRYHLAMQRRHNIALHHWGIVAGLELSLDNDSNLQLLPGMAIDGYGREIILTTSQPISSGGFDEKGSDTLDVLIEYQRHGSDLRSQGLSDCDTDDSTSFYRWQEEPVVRLNRPDPNFTNRRMPGTVPQADLAFEPFRVPPDDPQYDWPVFLGQISRERQRPGQPYTYTFNHANRPYAGLVGAQVGAPSGKARLELGPHDQDDTRRFGVFVQADLVSPGNKTNAPPAQDQAQELLALEIDRAGKLDIHCATIIHDGLMLDKSAIEFHAGVVGDHERPWQIYYIEALQNSAPNQSPAPQPPTNNPAKSYELRIEVPPGQENSVVIGATSPDDNKFKPCLTIADLLTTDMNGQPALRSTVTVHGDLVVNGALYETQQRAVPQTSPEVQNIVLQSALSTIGTTIAPGIGGRLANESDLDVLKRALTTDGGRQLLAQTLAGSSSQLATFMDRLLDLALAKVSASLLASDARIVELVRNVLASPALAKVIGGLIADDSAVDLFTTHLLDKANTEQLVAVLTGVLKHPDGRRLLANTVAQDEQLASVIDQLLTTSANVLIDQLLKAPPATIQSLITKVVASPTLPDFVTAIVTTPELVQQLLRDENKLQLGEVITDILKQTERHTEVVTALEAVAEPERKAFVRSLVKNNKVQSSLIGDSEALKTVAQLITRRKNGQTAIATALIDLWNEDNPDISKLESLINALKAGPEEFRAQLRQALEDPPPPSTG